MIEKSIEKTSDTPLHHQLYCIFKELIENGTYAPYEKIPSERELQEEFGVSRITVRRAVSDLAHDGYLRKQHGKATIVLPIKNQRDITHLSSFSGDAKNKGAKVRSIILKIKQVPANYKISTALGVTLEEPVFLIKRLRTIDGEILSLQNSFVSGKIGIEIKSSDFDETTSLYEFLEQHGIELSSADETIETFLPDPEIRSQLFLDDNQWVFYKERITYDINNLAVEYSENYYVAEKFKYFVHITKL